MIPFACDVSPRFVQSSMHNVFSSLEKKNNKKQKEHISLGDA